MDSLPVRAKGGPSACHCIVATQEGVHQRVSLHRKIARAEPGAGAERMGWTTSHPSLTLAAGSKAALLAANNHDGCQGEDEEEAAGEGR